MKILIPTIFFCLTIIFTGPTNAIVLANSQGKSSIETSGTIASNIADSVVSKSLAVAEIEVTGDPQAGIEHLQDAADDLDDALVLLEDAVSEARSEEPLPFEEFSDVEIEPELLERLNLNSLEEIFGYLQEQVEPWPPTEQAMFRFLLDRTSRARGAIQVMQNGIENDDVQVIQLGLANFTNFEQAAIAYSVFWSTVEQ